MANIYLRVPTYVAQFYRGIDDRHLLGEFDAVEFIEFQHEYVLMQNMLRLVNEPEQTSSWCYSQRAWQNILRGKAPTGGQQILNRSADEWPTMQEICTLAGEKNVQKLDGYDYLCIQMPTEVLMGDVIRRTNASYSLRPKEAMAMTRLLRTNFVHVFLDWVIQDRRYCNKVGLQRPIGVTIERFFERYYIFIGRDRKERDSMYRMARRWIEDAHLLPNDRLDFGGEDIEYIDEKTERPHIEKYNFVKEIDRELDKKNEQTNVKVAVKKA